MCCRTIFKVFLLLTIRNHGDKELWTRNGRILSNAELDTVVPPPKSASDEQQRFPSHRQRPSLATAPVGFQLHKRATNHSCACASAPPSAGNRVCHVIQATSCYFRLTRRMRGRFLREAAAAVKDTCPGLSRYLMSLHRLPEKKKRKERGICPFCFQILLPDNHKVRLKPKMKITPQIENLLKREAKCHRLNLKQARLLRKYKLSSSCLVVTCNTCQKISKYPGESRMVIANSPGTPKMIRNFGSPDLRKPGSNRKVNLSYSEEKLSSKTRSPLLTPRSYASATSSPALIAKSAKKGKFHFSRLKMLLDQEEKEQNKKQNLQNFLTSLS